VNMDRASQITYLLLRMVAGLLLLQSGGLILFGWFGGMPDHARLVLMSQTGIGGILEFAGGLAILLGLFTRPAAFISSGMMAVAYWQFHFPQGRWPVQNNGMPAVLLCFVCLYIATRGGAEYSLDAVLRGKSAREETAPGTA
jgi:putative oxidoreductase